jgi:aquaporin Z
MNAPSWVDLVRGFDAGRPAAVCGNPGGRGASKPAFRAMPTTPAAIDPRPAHWAEYAIEAAALGAFMASATLVTTLLEHPSSPVHQAVPDATLRRVIVGLAMGATLVALVYSPLGRRSGAHLNPVVTLTFLRLGKIRRLDALGYACGQVVGAVGVMIALAALWPAWVSHPAVRYVATLPGPAGAGVALAAEAAISFGMMTLVLHLSNSPRWSRYTGLCAGLLVAAYIAVEAPLSGMSMNPARSLGPAAAGGPSDFLWVYVAGPLAGMTLAAEVYVRRRGLAAVLCAKLHHDIHSPCIFRCGYADAHAAAAPSAPGPPAAQALVHP